MNLKILFVVHAVVTFAAGIVLLISPGLIPSAVDIQVPKANFLICYLLAASEIALAVLSFGARNIIEHTCIRLICLTFIILHLSSAAFEVYDYSNGLSDKIWSNILLRILISILFLYYGIYKSSNRYLNKIKS